MTDLVFVHGWSVSHTNTYGDLPKRLIFDGRQRGLRLRERNIYLGRYVSFHDEVRVEDLAKAMEAAVDDAKLGRDGRRFYCITHSTGGPVVRDWYDRYHAGTNKCPMSHLVMLAPANFGSALAVLGKGRLGRIKAWFGGVEPGQGVLDWLSLGSAEAWDLNHRWNTQGQSEIGKRRIFPFVVTGQSIDRKLYDHLNTYTGESGSDGVVRVAAANLNATDVALRQVDRPDAEGFSRLEMDPDVARGPAVPLRVVRNKSHSGKEMGIMRSVKARPRRRNDPSVETVDAILRCFEVDSLAGYKSLHRDFERESAQVQRDERVETEKRLLLGSRVFIHDRYAQVIFRLRDDRGHPIYDFDLLLTAGKESDANHLPEGFICDTQANRRISGTITFFVNYDVLAGASEIPGHRAELPGIKELGFEVHPRPDDGFVHYRKCRIKASSAVLKKIVRPNETTMVDITTTRVVHKEAFRLDRTTEAKSFKRISPETPIN
jgi:hypothetical protein